ncbi:alanine acetyltransferase [Thalassobaculum fulvum]|uniref:Alanine acetyltransferase n=1 Tax=Thalassobaculum fulvum TaxID=1633335 RepID=A0A918XLZ7_9PROT|nr:GNAT family N-acetyltransferase [Thalassobaculum fulvum]GHD38872.1 alanine acetyltransferase [Thalassobaculum fulvum]
MSNPLHRSRRATEIRFPETLDLGATVLRQLRLGDAEAVFRRYAADPEVTRWLTFRTLRDVEEARGFCTLMEKEWEAGLTYTYALLEPGDPTPFGTVSARVDEFHVSFGYAMARDRWGRGHGSRALSALVEAALAQDGIFRAWAFCDAENPASARVMEKAGMTYEGRLRRWHVAPNVSPEPRDCLAYAKVR